MKAAEIKMISLELILEHEGFRPTKIVESNLWYKSPFRAEENPSFKVDKYKNLWYDFGMGEGGDVINFIMRFKHLSFVKSLQYLEPILLGMSFLSRTDSATCAKQTERRRLPGINVLSTGPITYGPLLEYLHSRRITDDDIISKYCKAVRYQCRCKNYFAIGFQNDSGGYELRSKYAKLAISPKDITTIHGTNSQYTCHVFEGFMDFLSFLMIYKDNSSDSLVLNSLSSVEKSLPKLMSYRKVELHLDNDNAGQNATKRIMDSLRSVNTIIDRSTDYTGYKDLNEFLCKKV